MNDMKRRVAGILEFISHTQVEMAGLDASRSRSHTLHSTKTSLSSTATPPDINLNGDSNGAEIATAKDFRNALSALGEMEEVDEETFGKLSAVGMMEVLTRRLMRWQREYGKYGEK